MGWQKRMELNDKDLLRRDHRAPMIGIKRRLNGEIERIKKILLDNGYPKNVINAQIEKSALCTRGSLDR